MALFVIKSLDAGATSISIICDFTKDDFKLIQIRDNGCGIKEGDFASACERFATSKISSFDSLSNLTTFGFRGEALASISQVSILEILSKRPECEIGYNQRYRDGKPFSSRPEPKACNDGTIIKVHDLFYNNDHRKKSLSGLTVEFKKMVELVSLYSLDNLNVSFHMTKSHGKDVEISTHSGATLRERISSVLSSKTSANLIDFSCKDEKLKFSALGVIGDLSSSLPNFRFVFFINRRLVQFPSLSKSLEVLYKDKLAKGSCSFVYLTIQVEPSFVDSNVHPSKNEVRLINDQEVVNEITREIELSLNNQKEREIHSSPYEIRGKNTINTIHPQPSSSSKASHVQSTLDSSFGAKNSREFNSSLSSSRPDKKVRQDLASQRIDEMFHKQKTMEQSSSDRVKPKDDEYSECKEFYFKDGRRMTNLESVLALRKDVQKAKSVELSSILTNSSYVGSRNSNIPALFIQYDVNLIQLDLPELTKEMFYQMYLFDFGNFDQLIFEEAVSIRAFAQIHMARKNEEKVIDGKLTTLISMSAMVNDYFSLGISSQGKLTAIPQLLNGYVPSWSGLPELSYDLLFNVDWTDERKCFETFGRSLAKFYMAKEDSCKNEQQRHFQEMSDLSELSDDSTDSPDDVTRLDSSQDNSQDSKSSRTQDEIKVLPPLDDPFARKGIIASVIYPALKGKFLPSHDHFKYFLLRTSVPKLYKVFHRC